MATEFQILDDTTVIYAFSAPALMTAPVVIDFAIPLKSTANKAFKVKAATTGTNIYVNAQGYTD